MNILWTYAADIKKIVSGLREMIESGHRPVSSLTVFISKGRKRLGSSWLGFLKICPRILNVKFLTDE